MQTRGMIRAGAICLIILAIANIGLDLINALTFSLPMALQGDLEVVLPQTLGQNLLLHDLLVYNSLLPLLLIPGAVGTCYFFSEQGRPVALTALIFAAFGVFAWMISQMFWPSVNWYIAQALMTDNTLAAQLPPGRLAFALVGGLNSFVLVYFGLYIKILALSLWMFLISLLGLRERNLPEWFCYFGVILAIIAWVLLVLRVIITHPYLLSHGLNFFPIINLWIFLLGCYFLLSKKDRV